MTVKKYTISNNYSNKLIDEDCIKINSKVKINIKEINVKTLNLRSKDSFHARKNMHKNCLDWKVFNLDNNNDDY